MESLLWAIDLIAVTYLCYWALRQDSLPEEAPQPPGAPKGKK
ncbi:hypothetical protein [Massilia sp. TSP1-1-2]